MPPRKRKQQSRIARFRVTLDEVIPPIRRVLEIDADGTFWELHVAIQDAFGWLDYHLHVFEVPGPEARTMIEIGIPDPDGFDDRGPVLPGWETPISAYLVAPGDQVHYVYDFGDDWRHTVVLEALGPAQPGTRYPRCVDGMRAGPPEDCGGPANTSEDVDKLIKLLRIEGHAKILDLCCGRGRHSLELSPRGFDVVGVDRTASYIEKAKLEADKLHLNATFVIGDMREYCVPNTLDIIINMFGSFGYFENPDDDRKVVENMYVSLRSGGQFLIETGGKRIKAVTFRKETGAKREIYCFCQSEKQVRTGAELRLAGSLYKARRGLNT